MSESWSRNLLSWYHRHRRELPWRDTPTPYRVWVSEIMLQQTRVSAVRPYFLRFMEAFPTIVELAAADQQKVLKLWEGLGYYSRARNLHRAAREVVASGGELPASEAELRKLPGIGPYTAAAIASIAFGQYHAAVDGNVLRVAARLYKIHDDIRAVKTRDVIATRLQKVILGVGDPSAFNQAMMELGALVCLPRNPQCGSCPLRGECRALLSDCVAELPFRKPKKKIPEYEIAVGLVVHENRILVAKRDETQMLGGLWEFPGGKREGGESLKETCAREIREETGLEVTVGEEICTIRHAYSHFCIVLSAFWCTAVSAIEQLACSRPTKWVAIPELEQLPFPGANHKIFAHLPDTPPENGSC